MGLFDIFRKRTSESGTVASDTTPENAAASSKEDIYKKIFEQMSKQSPSRHFASGSVFDVVRQHHDVFEKIVRSKNVMAIQRFFATAYLSFCNDPSSAGVANADIVDKSKNDTNPSLWNTSVYTLEDEDMAALCYMPVKDNAIEARLISIVLGQNGDGYYYCMLSKDESEASDVMRNKALLGIEKAGEVKGRGFGLLDAYLECIKSNYYS